MRARAVAVNLNAAMLSLGTSMTRLSSVTVPTMTTVLPACASEECLVAVHSAMVDRMQSGFSARKAAFIVTREPDLLAREILRTLNRGCTFFLAKGGMTQQETRVIYTVVNFIELARLKEILYNMDPNAFLAVHTTSEVIGNRFISWEQEGFEQKRRRRSQRVRDACTGAPPAPGTTK